MISENKFEFELPLHALKPSSQILFEPIINIGFSKVNTSKVINSNLARHFSFSLRNSEKFLLPSNQKNKEFLKDTLMFKLIASFLTSNKSRLTQLRLITQSILLM